jgi:hypothetical protein
LYRYRTGDKLSAWMRSDELRAHAADGRIRPDSSIQQVGKENWIQAGKVPGLWAGAHPGGSTVTGEAFADHNGHGHDVADGHTAGNGGAGSAGGAGGAGSAGSAGVGGAGHGVAAVGSINAGNGSHAGNGSNGGGAGHAPAVHHSRLGESIQHLLQRAILGHVTVSAPEFDSPQRAILAGVTSDAVALEFETCGTVVYIPWTRVRSVAVPSKEAHSTARIRAHAEVLVIDVERIPANVAQTQVHAAR